MPINSTNMSNNSSKWYVVQCPSKKEVFVSKALESIFEDKGLTDLVDAVVAPQKTVIGTRNGRPVSTTCALYPGYIYLKAKLTPAVKQVVTNGVAGPSGNRLFTKFPGHSPASSSFIVPLSLKEAEMAESFIGNTTEEKTFESPFSINEYVRIVSGPFSSFEGKIISFNSNSTNASLTVQVFGRPTTVSVDTQHLQSI
jgi:transcriptional antiterminator NusG